MAITNDQFQVALQSIQNKYVRLELLNYNYQVVDELSGVCTGGSLSEDANADARRSGNLNIVVTDSSFEVASGSKVWLDKYIKVWIGIERLTTKEIVWNNEGIYILDAPSYKYNIDTNTLDLDLLDLMCNLSGERNGYLPGLPVKLNAGEKIRDAIIDTLQLANITRYVIEDPPTPGTIPTPIELGQGTTIYNILVALKDIYPGYEMFFDEEGVFYYKKIPSEINAPVQAKDSLWTNIVISEDIQTDFKDVKNHIEVYGRTHDPTHFSNQIAISNQNLNILMDSVTSYTVDMIYGFETDISLPFKDISSIKINSLSSYSIKQSESGVSESVSLIPSTYYCIQFKGNYWLWLGHLQAYGVAEDTNPLSPFYVNSSIGVIRLPLYDGEYANCITDDLAQQRAEYELWLHTNMQNSITLNIIPVYFLNVNMLVEYTSLRNGQKNLYIIKSINVGLGPEDTGTINMIQFYGNQYDAITKNDYIIGGIVQPVFPPSILA